MAGFCFPVACIIEFRRMNNWWQTVTAYFGHDHPQLKCFTIKFDPSILTGYVLLMKRDTIQMIVSLLFKVRLLLSLLGYLGLMTRLVELEDDPLCVFVLIGGESKE